MKKFIRIESKGIIDPQAFILLGASTKRQDDSKIGFFGSGLKYSIAYLLRNKIQFKVFADYNEIKFETKSTGFREQQFDVIHIGGKETSMTTEMGMDWEAWFVIREIYCNALDEGDSNITVVDETNIVPIEDKTVFYFEVSEQFKVIIDNWDKYFSENRKDIIYFDVDGNKIFTGGAESLVYRKGIRCRYIDKEKSLFNYDIANVDINESRVIKDNWTFNWNLRQLLQKITDKSIIGHILNTINDCAERSFTWDQPQYSNAWQEVIGEKILVPVENAGFWQEIMKKDPHLYLTLPADMIKGLKSKFLDKIKEIGDVEESISSECREVKELSKKQQYKLDSAIEFLTGANYKITHPIKVVEFQQTNRLGQALNGQILLSTKIIDAGMKELVACIVEEEEHLITGHNDETRAFQSHFIHKFVSALEDLTGKYL